MKILLGILVGALSVVEQGTFEDVTVSAVGD